MAGKSSGTFGAQWRWLSWVLMAIVTVAALVFGTLDARVVESDGERVASISATIRCPQCRGQSVAESNVTIAREIRADIRLRIAEGQSDDEIRQAYIDRFGRSVVLTPDAGGFTGLVWIIPVVAAAAAIAAVAFAFARWRNEALADGDDDGATASDADRALVEKYLSEHDMTRREP